MTDTVGVLTAEEQEVLPEQARNIYRICAVFSSGPGGMHSVEDIAYLCYELAQAKLEVRRLRDESL